MIEGLRRVFNSGVTKSYEWRKKQLDGMLKLLEENRDKIAQGLKEDRSTKGFENLTKYERKSVSLSSLQPFDVKQILVGLCRI